MKKFSVCILVCLLMMSICSMAFAAKKTGSVQPEDFAFKGVALGDTSAVMQEKLGEPDFDTKFEFGIDENGTFMIGDEMLTPDSSRFWPLEGYEAGKSQPSYDKQFVRDWLKANPDSDYLLPDEIIDKTIAKYKEAYALLSGKEL